MEHTRKVISASRIVGAIVLIFVSLVCLAVPAHAANTPPQLGAITPSSGTFLTNTARSFTATYIDPNGYVNIRYAYLLINSSLTSSRGFYAYYNQTAKTIYFLSDANTWIGGYAPGSANVLENSYVKIDCSKTTVSGSGQTLSINWNITFKSTFAGTKNAYMYVSDASTGAGWAQKGTWRINTPPQLGTITPSSGTLQTNIARNFITTYIDPDGYVNIRYAYLLINSSLTSSRGFYAYYNQTAKTIYFLSDANTWIGGYAPGSANVLENSYVKIDCSKTTVSGSGQTLSINWNITFKSTFAGTKNAYMYVSDASTGAGWAQKGTWRINTPPQLGAITPSSGSSQANTAVNFTDTYIDPDGYADIRYAFFIVNIGVTTWNGLYAYYDQAVNKLYVANDNGTFPDGCAPGSSNILENSYVKVDCSKTSVSGSGATLTVNWNITFKPAFAGAKNTYLYAMDNNFAYTAWVQKGTWKILMPPQVGNVTPESGQFNTNKQTTFTANYSDPAGWGYIKYFYILINNSNGESNAVCARYDTKEAKLYLKNEAGTDWVNTYENSLVKIYAGDMRMPDNNTLSVDWLVTFKPPFNGLKNIYLRAANIDGSDTGWVQRGTCAIMPPPTAEFTADKTSGNIPLSVQFSDLSAGNITGWLWNFGDGQTSTERSPRHTYSSIGWNSEYGADQLPQNSNPAWTRVVNGVNNFESLADGVLHLKCDMINAGLHYTRNAIFSAEKEYAVETRFKLGELSYPVSYGSVCIAVTDGTYSWRLDFNPGYIGIGFSATYFGTFAMDTQSDYHVYKAVANNGIIDVYVDGVKRLTADMSPTRDYLSKSGDALASQITFGNSGGGSGPPPGVMYAEAYWDYVKYRDSASLPAGADKYYEVSLTVTGPYGYGFTTKRNYIHGVFVPPNILTNAFSDAVVGGYYEENLNAVDGVSPYTWSIDSGSLPDGLVLDYSTGKISGSPKDANNFSFTVKVTDSNMMTDTQVLSIRVLPGLLLSDEELLDQTEAKAALFFYNEALSNGFVKDGNHKDFSSIAATGFGLASLCVMAERYGTTANWTVTPAQAKARVNQILDECIRIQDLQASGYEYGTAGFLYHFITQDGAQQSGSEISTIDMALFLVGAITAGEYFGLDVKNKVNQIMAKLNWNYFLVTSKKQFSHGCYYGGSLIPGTWDRPGDEAILVSLMALAAEPENRSYLDTMYSWPRKIGQYGGYKVVNSYFGSLFTYIFANCYFDFQKLGVDNPILAMSPASPVDWWANSVNAAYANRQFCIDQSVNYASYGPDSWGITACEYPNGGYAALLGAAPCEYNSGRPIHDGTIAPYGAISCMPFMRTSMTENLSDNLAFKALKYFHDTYYNNLWGPYGPRDSFNQEGEFNPYYYGLDLGSIVIMIENYRSRLVWDTFMKNEKIMAATAKVFGQGSDIPPPVTLYVDVANSADQNQDGSQAHPFDHIWKVFTYNEGNNCIIQIAPGEYEYSGIVAERKFSLAIKGVIGDRSDPLNTTANTVFVGSSINIVQTKFASIENLVMTACGKDFYGYSGPIGSYGGAIYAESCDSLLVNNCIFLNNLANKGSAIYCGNFKTAIVSNSLFRENRGHQSGTIHIFSDSYNPDWSAEISNNEIINNYAWVSGAGIRVEDSNVSISDNLIYNNRADDCAGVFLSGAQGEVKNNLVVKNYADRHGGGGIICEDAPVLITNNVIYKNRVVPKTWGGGSGIQISGTAVPIITNNIIAENTHEGIRNYGTSPVQLNYNNVYNNGTANYLSCSAGVGSLSSPPLFVLPDVDGDENLYGDFTGNPDNDDYHLQTGSSCIDTGDPDIKFNDAADSTRNDMGVYGGPYPMPDGR